MVWTYHWGVTNGIKEYLNQKCKALVVPPTIYRSNDDARNLRAEIIIPHMVSKGTCYM